MSPELRRTFFLVVAGVLLCTAGCSGAWWRGAEEGRKGYPKLLGGHGMNGGWTCLVCVTAVSLAEQKAEINNQTIVRALQTICSFLPDDFEDTCYSFLETATPILIKMSNEKFSPDVSCRLMNLCYTDPGQATCSLYPTPSSGMERTVEKIRRTLPKRYQTKREVGLDICAKLPIFKEFCEQTITDFKKYHMPVVDFDSDNFSSVMKTLRGSYWKGKDCRDFDPHIHPGAKAINQDKYVDSDCNGIYGIDPESGKPYEEVLCAQTQHMGVGILGDSAGAHMHIPKEWFTASELNAAAFQDVAMIVANEFDWPMTSTATGYMNSTWSVLTGPTDSLYLRMRDLNLCNHRDFQNVGANGARLIDPENKYGFTRDQENDQPMILVFSMIGNDVCNWHNNTVAYMTTEEQIKDGFIETMQYLDTKLPNGSHVISTGLVDGRILYDSLHDRVHPLGEWRQDLKYPDVYNFVSCLAISPCNGWMSSNETLRNVTSERAANLSKVIEKMSGSYQAQNFDIHYFPIPFEEVIEKWEEQGGEAWQLIEPVDGFHPNQIAVALFTEHFWEMIQETCPEILKTWTNPNNARIRAIFGDQGGY